MASYPEEARRVAELGRLAPMRPRGRWVRGVFDGQDVVFLCGTLGAEFDAWQRRLAATSAADALLSQQIGLDAVERVMDEVEAEARAALAREGLRLLPRRSPGYGDLPLDLSREILARLDAGRRLGVFLTETNLLVPSKSVTAVCDVEGLKGD